MVKNNYCVGDNMLTQFLFYNFVVFGEKCHNRSNIII